MRIYDSGCVSQYVREKDNTYAKSDGNDLARYLERKRYGKNKKGHEKREKEGTHSGSSSVNDFATTKINWVSRI